MKQTKQTRTLEKSSLCPTRSASHFGSYRQIEIHDLVQSRSLFSFFLFFLSSRLSPLLPSPHSNYGTIAPRVDTRAPLSNRQQDRSPGILEQLRCEMSCNALRGILVDTSSSGFRSSSLTATVSPPPRPRPFPLARILNREASIATNGLNGQLVYLGVLWSGDHCFPGTVETLELLRRNGAHQVLARYLREGELTLPCPGKQVVFVTNNSTKSRADYRKKLESLGIPSTVVSQGGHFEKEKTNN